MQAVCGSAKGSVRFRAQGEYPKRLCREVLYFLSVIACDHKGQEMEVIRCGSKYNYGERKVSLNNLRFSYDESLASVIIKSSGVKNFTGESRHDYTVILSSDELVEVVSVLAALAVIDPRKFEDILSPALKPLIKLGLVASGAVKIFGE